MVRTLPFHGKNMGSNLIKDNVVHNALNFYNKFGRTEKTINSTGRVSRLQRES